MDRFNRNNTLLIYVLSAILIISIINFGSVEVWSFSIISFLILTLFMYVFFVKKVIFMDAVEDGVILDSKEKYLFYIILIFLIYILFQIIPLPNILIKFISSKTYELRSYYSLENDIYSYLSFYPYKTQLELVRVMVYIAFFLLVAFTVNNINRFEAFIKTLCYFGFILAIFSIVQKATFNGKIYWFRELTIGGTPFGPFVNRNHYAGLINMLIMIGLGIMFTRYSIERKLLFGFFSVIMALSLFISLSRGGIISFFSGIGLFTLLIIKEKIKNKKLIAIILFLITLVSYLLYIGIDPLIDRFYKVDMDSKVRFIIWSDTFKIFRDFSLTGTGLGTFVYIYPLYSSRNISYICDHAHNDYLEYLSEIGIIGMSLFLIFLILYLKIIFSKNKSEKQNIFSYAILSSILTMAAHSVFDFNLHIPSNALTLSAVFGLGYANHKIGKLG